MCSSTGRPSSGLNLGNHISGDFGRAWRGASIFTAPGLFHGFIFGKGTWTSIGPWVDVMDWVWVEEEAGWVLELVEGIVVWVLELVKVTLIVGVEVVEMRGGNGGEWDKISLAIDSYSILFILFWVLSMGNSKGIIHVFWLSDRVNILQGCK